MFEQRSFFFFAKVLQKTDKKEKSGISGMRLTGKVGLDLKYFAVHNKNGLM